MTKAEAIDMCMEVRDYLTSGNPIWDKDKVGEALDMAIEALEQVTGKLNNPEDSLLKADPEACKEQKSKLDLISRAEAIEAIEIVDWYHQNQNKDMVSGANDDEHQAWYKAEDVYKALEAIPSANRPKDGDLISRTEAIEALGEEPPVWCDEEYEIAERDKWRADIEAIKSVPSADRLPSADRPTDEFDGMIFSTDKYMAFVDKKEIHILRKGAHKVTVERTFNTEEDEE